MIGSLRILVIGALGGVGEGIVHALLGRRAELAGLAVSSRDGERLARFHASLEFDALVQTFVGSVETTKTARQLRDAVREWGSVDVVIASLGGWWSGPLLTDVDDATWTSTLDRLLTTHAVCARTFVPELEASNGKYLLVGGGAGLRPVPGSALVSIAGAAQIMLTRALVAERGESRPPLVRELVVDSPIATSGPHHGPKTEGEITAREVGDAIAAWAIHANAERPDAFAWPQTRFETDGPITIMRRRRDR